MARVHTCEQGHSWDAVDAATPCPVCGSLATGARETPPAVGETLENPIDNPPANGTDSRATRDYAPRAARRAPRIEPVVFDSDPELTLPAERAKAAELDRYSAQNSAAVESHPTIPGYEILGELG